MNKYEVLMEWRLAVQADVFGENPNPVSLFPP